MSVKITNMKLSKENVVGSVSCKLTADVELGPECTEEDAIKLLNKHFFGVGSDQANTNS